MLACITFYRIERMDIVGQLNNLAAVIKVEFPFILSWIGIAWALQVFNVAMGYRLNIFGILPRSIIGIPGIFISPFLHGDFNHLFMNSMFFVAMGSMLILHGKTVFYTASISIIIISGVIVWTFGRYALHIGASSLIMGYWSFLCTKAYFQPNLLDILSAGLGMYYCGIHLTASLLARGPNVSEEGHISGFIAGIVTAMYYTTIAPSIMHFIKYIR